MKSLINFFSRRYWLFLNILLVVSYGQILWMQPWEDDNALFFKLAHIQEAAGYFGYGPFGSGVYKYAATPFIIIYNLFGFNVVAYFAFLLIFYLLTTIVVYKTFSIILGEIAGRVAGFFYAAGYVVSDGFWRIANSVTTSYSIILVCLAFVSYWKFYKSAIVRWYFLALLFFFLAAELSIVRTHYFFIVVVLFELLFLLLKKLPRSIIYSIVRLIPFSYIFYRQMIVGGDPRSVSAKDFVLAIFKGDFDEYYGFLASLANLIVPDWIINRIFSVQGRLSMGIGINIPFLKIFLLVLPALIIILLLWKHAKGKLFIPALLLVLCLWVLFSKNLFLTPLLNLGEHQFFTVALGGVLLLLALAGAIALANNKRLFVLLTFWLLVNLAAYSAYYPTVVYGTVNRYLAHSFVPLVGIMGLLFITLFRINIIGKVWGLLILSVALGNVYHAVIYQNGIIQTRSRPTRKFYSDLRANLSEINKGDIFYIDVAREVQHNYRDATAVAMMPETTALAWRYGVDRYDLKLTNDFQELVEIVSADDIPLEQVKSFWYSEEGIIDTSKTLRKSFSGSPMDEVTLVNSPLNSVALIDSLSSGTSWFQPDLLIEMQQVLPSVLPVKVSFDILASPLQVAKDEFPIFAPTGIQALEPDSFWKDRDLRALALEYQKEKVDFTANSEFRVSSEWQDRVVGNLYDGDVDSVWQSDRVLWQDKKSFIQINLKSPIKISKLAWVNGFSDHTPTRYSVEVSDDGRDWITVKEVDSFKRIVGKELQIISFEPISARFLRLVITDTLNGDSPAIGELRFIPDKFSVLDIEKAEAFFESPFAYVSDQKLFNDTLLGLERKGTIEVFWTGNKSQGWQSAKQAEINLVYDGRLHQYQVILPAGGTSISGLKLSNAEIPGTLTIMGITGRYLTKDEFTKMLQ